MSKYYYILLNHLDLSIQINSCFFGGHLMDADKMSTQRKQSTKNVMLLKTYNKLMLSPFVECRCVVGTSTNACTACLQILLIRAL